MSNNEMEKKRFLEGLWEIDVKIRNKMTYEVSDETSNSMSVSEMVGHFRI